MMTKHTAPVVARVDVAGQGLALVINQPAVLGAALLRHHAHGQAARGCRELTTMGAVGAAVRSRHTLAVCFIQSLEVSPLDRIGDQTRPGEGGMQLQVE